MEYQCTDEDALSHDGIVDGNEQAGEGEQTLSQSTGCEESIDALQIANPVENPQEDGPNLSQPSEPNSSQPPESSQAEGSPASVPGVGKNRKRSIPAVRIPDSLSDASRFNLRLRRYWHPAQLLVPNVEHLRSIESQSKSFGMVVPQDLPIHAGVTWSIVDLCTAPNLSPRMIEAINCFARINSLASNYSWNDFVVPTQEIECSTSTKLKPIYATNGKDIKGVVLEEMMDREGDHVARETLDDILLADDASELAEGDVQKSLPFLSISVSFTAAVFHNERSGKDEVALFGVVRVTTLLNVDAFDFIINRILAPPPINSKSFKESSKRISQLMELLEHIIIYQACEVMGDRSNERPMDYFRNPSGRLGIHKVCLPAFEPYKMCKLLQRHYKPKNVRIIGYPEIDWLGESRDPEEVVARGEYREYTKAIRGHRMEACSTLRTACGDFKGSDNANKKRRRRPDGRQEGGPAEEELSEAKEYRVLSHYGWPVRRHQNWYVEFLGSLCPLEMQYRPLREMDPTETYESFCINLGSLPPLALCLLRCCVLFDGTDSISTDLLLLREIDVEWDLAMIRQRFYSVDCRTHDHIAMPGCQLGHYKEVMRYIRSKVELGDMSTHSAVQLLLKVVRYGLNVFKGMAESNAFLSNRVTEVMRIMKIIEHDEASGKSSIHRNLRTYQRYLMQMDDPKSPFRHVFYSPYDLARKTLLVGVTDMNIYKKLNSQNLALLIELMMSQIGHCTGSNNDTHTPFGRAIELAPGCGTLSAVVQCGNQRITVRYMANDNSAGKDYSSKIVSDIFEEFCCVRGVQPSNQGLTILKRFTETGLENNGRIQFGPDGNVLTTPDPKTNRQFFAITESRGGLEQEANTLIQFGYCRGDQQKEISLTTFEGERKQRENISKELMTYPAICVRCSNQETRNENHNEQLNTIAAVTPFLEPGSSILTPSGQEGGFTDVPSSAYETRKQKMEGITATCAPDLLAGMSLYASTWLGLANTISTVGFEICRTSLAVLDWLTFFTQKHLETLFHSRCKGNNLLRLQKVYEARATSFTAWCRMVQYNIQYPDRDDAIARAVNSLQFDALALTDCPGMIWSLLRRCLHWGPILYSCCFIRECDMPVVPIQVLVDLLRRDSVPPAGTEAREWYDKVALWLVDCVAQNRFCPTGDGGQFSEFLSSSGMPDGSVETNGCLRVASARNAWADKTDRMAAQNLLAESVFQRYGAELRHSCGVSQGVMACAINDMLQEFSMDIQRLLNVNMFDMERHFAFFGIRDRLDFAFMERIGPHPFSVRAVWQKDPRESYSIGAGIHVIQLMVLGSMAGNFLTEKLHPKIINDLSLGLLTYILRFAPKGMVPGNNVEIRAFNCFNCSLESVVLEKDHMRTESFIRCHDVTFAEMGIQSRCGNVENFAPEDVLHMGPHCEVASRIGCKVTDLPPADVTYFIRPGRAYCVHNVCTGCLGILIYNEENFQVTLEYQEHPEDVGFSAKPLELLRWQDELKGMGFTMLPMIWRSGACIAWMGRVGCLVPPPGRNQHDGNFSIQDLGYTARLSHDEEIKVPVMQTLSNLLPVGQKVFLDMSSDSAASVARRLPVAIRQGELASTALKVHLTVPDTLEPQAGKVFVACLVKQLNVNNRSMVVGSYCEIIVVDPWELSFLDEGRSVLDYILQ